MKSVDMNKRFSQQSFADLVGISQPAVSNLISRGVLRPEMTGLEALHAYCLHLRSVAAGRLANGDLDLATERAALAKAQRERIELQNAVTRREQAPVALLEQVLAGIGARVGGILDSIVPRLRRRNRSLTAEDLAAVGWEVSKARRMMARLQLSEVLVEGDGTADSADQQPAPSEPAAAESEALARMDAAKRLLPDADAAGD